MKKTKSTKKITPVKKASKPKAVAKKKAAPAGKGKLKKDWQEDPEVEGEEKTEEDDSFAEEEPKLENLDEDVLDGDEEDEEEDFFNEDSGF